MEIQGKKIGFEPSALKTRHFKASMGKFSTNLLTNLLAILLS
jgi:hypothetical protein